MLYIYLFQIFIKMISKRQHPCCIGHVNISLPKARVLIQNWTVLCWSTNFVSACQWSLEYADCIICRKIKLFPPLENSGCPIYDTKLYLVVTLHFWSLECRLTLSLPLITGPLLPKVVVPVRVPSMGQIDLLKIIIGQEFLKLYNSVRSNVDKLGL